MTKARETGGSTRSDADQPPAAGGDGAAGGLFASPEFLIRRAHQIASAAFVEACAELNLTPSQYAALFALRQHGVVGQNELGRSIALDRSTTSLVVKSLRERRLVTADADPVDRRKTLLGITNKGRLLLARAEQLSAKASHALMAVFSEKQAADFLAMLRLLNETTSGRSDDP